MAPTQARWTGWSYYTALVLSALPMLAAPRYFLDPKGGSEDIGLPYHPTNGAALAVQGVHTFATLGLTSMLLALTDDKQAVALSLIASALAGLAELGVVAYFGQAAVSFIVTTAVMVAVYGGFGLFCLQGHLKPGKWTGPTYWLTWVLTILPVFSTFKILSGPAAAAAEQGLPFVSATQAVMSLIATRNGYVALVSFFLVLAQDRRGYGVTCFTAPVIGIGDSLVLWRFGTFSSERAVHFVSICGVVALFGWWCVAGSEKIAVSRSGKAGKSS